MSVVQGARQLWAPEPLAHVRLGLVILLLSAVAEAFSLVIGFSSVKSAARKTSHSVWQYLRLGPDPMGVAVVLEDAAAVIEDNPVVARIKDVKVSQIGADSVRFKAEVTFDGRELARRLLATKNVDGTWARLRSAEDLRRLLIEFGGQVTDAIGDEVDRIEEDLAEVAPETRHVDLEPD